MRAFYVLFPAILLGLLAAPLHSLLGVFVTVFMTSIGYAATETRPERGEGIPTPSPEDRAEDRT